jgi:hypothetical protein
MKTFFQAKLFILFFLVLTNLNFAKPIQFNFTQADVQRDVQEPLLLVNLSRDRTASYLFGLELGDFSPIGIYPNATQLDSIVILDKHDMYKKLPTLYLSKSCKNLKNPKIYLDIDGNISISIKQINSRLWGTYYEATCLYLINPPVQQ